MLLHSISSTLSTSCFFAKKKVRTDEIFADVGIVVILGIKQIARVPVVQVVLRAGACAS